MGCSLSTFSLTLIDLPSPSPLTHSGQAFYEHGMNEFLTDNANETVVSRLCRHYIHAWTVAGAESPASPSVRTRWLS